MCVTSQVSPGRLVTASTVTALTALQLEQLRNSIRM
jgi:hypothetical protein